MKVERFRSKQPYKPYVMFEFDNPAGVTLILILALNHLEKIKRDLNPEMVRAEFYALFFVTSRYFIHAKFSSTDISFMQISFNSK